MRRLVGLWRSCISSDKINKAKSQFEN
jgi:hypothetical protein